MREGHSEIVLLPHHRDPAPMRLFRSIFDIMREYPEMVGRERWCDRVFCERYTGETCAISELMGGCAPAVIRYFERAVRWAGMPL